MTSLSKLVLRGLLEPGSAVTITTNGGDQIVYQVRDRLGRTQSIPEEYRMRSWGDSNEGGDEDYE